MWRLDAALADIGIAFALSILSRHLGDFAERPPCQIFPKRGYKEETMKTQLKRSILDDAKLSKVAPALQKSLVHLIDLALTIKQAHWNVLGSNFRSVHLQLDEILVDVRAGSDEVAERLAALGVAADGRVKTVAHHTSLEEYPTDFQDVSATVSLIADAMMGTIGVLRAGIEITGELDPISEDLLIGISAPLEKHLWMVQSQEVKI